MNRRKSNIISLFLLIATLLCGPKTLIASNLLPNVFPKMEDPLFWVKKAQNPNRPLLSPEKIQKINEENFKNQELYLCDVSTMKEDWTREEILALLREDWEGFGKRDEIRYGKKGAPLDDSFWNGLRENWNQGALKEINRIRFGMIVKRTDIRVFPTDEPSVSTPLNQEFDQFQHSAIAPGSPVGIYHFSRDQVWAYVQTSFIRGWVRTMDLAVAKRREEVFNNEKEILVITGNSVKIFNDPLFRQQAFLAQMGTVFPIVALPEALRTSNPGYTVRIPKRESDGSLRLRNGFIPAREDVHRNFLPYTQENVARQAFKMLSHPYGWGDRRGGRDCSRFVMDIFNTFGLLMPRNSKLQAMMGIPLLPADVKSLKEKKKALDQAVPLATLIRTPGHIMLYLGKHRGRHYVIHSLWGFQKGGDWINPVVEKIGKVSVSDLNLGRKGPHGSLFDRITEVQFIGDDSFVKLPAHRAGLPGKEISFILCPLTPAYKAGLAGHLPVKKMN